MRGELFDVVRPRSTHERFRTDDKQTLAVFFVLTGEVHDLYEGLARARITHIKHLLTRRHELQALRLVLHGFDGHTLPLNSSISKDTGFKLLKSEAGVFTRASVAAPKVQSPCLLGWYGQYLHE